MASSHTTLCLIGWLCFGLLADGARIKQRAKALDRNTSLRRADSSGIRRQDEVNVQNTTVVTLTVLSLVGLCMNIAAKTMDGVAEIDLHIALEHAGDAMKRVAVLQKSFSDFYDSLQSDLEKLPDQWISTHGKLGETISALADGFDNPSGSTSVDINEVQKFANDKLKGLGMTVIGQVSDAASAATSAVSFVTSLVQLGSSIKQHGLTREDESHLEQTQQFRMLLHSQESSVYEAFCRFVKAVWEQAMAAEFLPRVSQFELDKNKHIAGEMQRAWRCHCISLDANPQKMAAAHAWMTDRLEKPMLLEPNGVYRNHVSGVMGSQGDRKRLLLRLSYANCANTDDSGCLNERLMLTADPSSIESKKRFVADIQVVHRKCDEGANNDTLSYEERLKARGYRLLMPTPADQDAYTNLKKQRHGDCLSVLGAQEVAADIQQGFDDKDYGVVLIYVKEGDIEHDIPISAVQVAYGTSAVREKIAGGWQMVPVPLYADESIFFKRLKIDTEVPFLVFKRDHATVPCPTLPSHLVHSCCEVGRPPWSTLNSGGGRRWCNYRPFIDKNPHRIAGYEAYIAKRFPNMGSTVTDVDLSWCDKHVPSELGESSGKRESRDGNGSDVSPVAMWLRGCDLAKSQVSMKCEEGFEGLVVREGWMKNKPCTGLAFLLEGDPFWVDPERPEKGRKYLLTTNVVLADALNVYGEAGVGPTCASGM